MDDESSLPVGDTTDRIQNDDDENVDTETETRGDDDVDDVDDDASENFVPDCDKANSISFAMLCHRMERLWSLRLQRKKISDLEKKQYLLPPKLLKSLEPQSAFPLLRLLLPDCDHSRNVSMKEKLIAQAYCDAEGFSKGTKNYEMLFGFTDPQKVPHSMAGDLSRVVQHILEQRIPNRPSKLTLGQMNALLDDLALIAQRRRSTHNHDWRNSSNPGGNAGSGQSNKPVSSSILRMQWIRKLMNKSLSPVEHKWVVRILLQKMEFGLGWKSLLNWFNPFAIELWNAHNSLKNLCDKVADPQYTITRKEELKRKAELEQGSGMVSRWEPQDQPAALGNTISPMLSSRVTTSDCMTKLEYNHREYRKKSLHPECLALKFPAICAEIKLDGERIVAHVQAEGQVTMQTRNGKWYSQLYSPVIGPALRKALSKYRVSVILDGEVEAWDDGRQELIPFGQNRTVANMRRGYMRRRGMEETVDQNLHVPADRSTPVDPNVMQVADDTKYIIRQLQQVSTESNNEAGKDCWLQYIIFDILYLDGPDAKKLFRDCRMEDDSMVPGSILHLTLLQRKLLLHQLLEEQPREVELCRAVVIRPNGDCVSAQDYFSSESPLMDDEYPGALLDSTQTAIQDCMPEDIQEIDRRRRKGRSDKDISLMRARAVESFYSTVVEENKMEGLVLKDIASPYILGLHSRNRKYWHKLKPDYEVGQSVDVVILGAFFATGLRHSGRLSHFLCGVLDENDPSSFMPALRVNGKSVAYEKLDQIMEITGYKAATADEPPTLGKWFEMDDHGKYLPDFISQRSYQRGEEDFDGWTFSKTTYPDLWIKPEDSLVLELNGQEFVVSRELSAGLTMRFPRIRFVRHEQIDGGAKSPYECDSHYSLFQIYYDCMRRRQENDVQEVSQTDGNGTYGRFLTPEEFARKPKKRKRKEMTKISTVPEKTTVVSKALEGCAFTVLEGNYSFDPTSLEAHDARDHGWLDIGMKVKGRRDVMEFILSHSGTIKVSTEGGDGFVVGGTVDDARVVNFVKGIEYARNQPPSKYKTKRGAQLLELAKHEGVLKWTFVFSIVHRWLTNQNLRQDRNSSIQTSSDWLLRPKEHDYLLQANSQNISSDIVFDLMKNENTTKLELLRAIETYNPSSDQNSDSFTWQRLLSLTVNANDSDLGAISTVFLPPFEILYPCVFSDDIGTDDTETLLQDILLGNSLRSPERVVSPGSDEILSSLPLVSALGAIITSHLDERVSYILCDLKDSEKKVTMEDISGRMFVNERRGNALIKKIRSLSNEVSVTFVSPSWVGARWAECYGN
eukprot:Nitzschia sp. Nitz4//scaffold52_size167869//42917//46816//NITZ4_002267-RA/size167869-processed-gene-0.92-mRNA-1//1//CDS//3329554008//2606//frame0